MNTATARKHAQMKLLLLGARAKRLRIGQNLTVEDLAKRSGVNKNTIVRFEKGLPTTNSTTYLICAALDTSEEQLLAIKVEENVDYKIMRREARNVTSDPGVSDLSVKVSDLNHKFPDGGQLNARILHLSGESSWRSHPGEELLFCLTGKVGVNVFNESFILYKGDAMFLKGENVHQYFNASDIKSSVLLSVWVDKDAKIDDVEYHGDTEDAQIEALQRLFNRLFP